MKKLFVLFMGLAVLSISIPATAHFQMVYTPESALEKAESIDLELVFTHPFEAGHTMDMGTPEQFFVVRKGKKKDLLSSLKPITWKSLTNSGKAYETTCKLRGMGDNVFCLVPAPYLEKEENLLYSTNYQNDSEHGRIPNGLGRRDRASGRDRSPGQAVCPLDRKCLQGDRQIRWKARTLRGN